MASMRHHIQQLRKVYLRLTPQYCLMVASGWEQERHEQHGACADTARHSCSHLILGHSLLMSA